MSQTFSTTYQRDSHESTPEGESGTYLVDTKAGNTSTVLLCTSISRGTRVLSLWRYLIRPSDFRIDFRLQVLEMLKKQRASPGRLQRGLEKLQPGWPTQPRAERSTSSSSPRFSWRRPCSPLLPSGQVSGDVLSPGFHAAAFLFLSLCLRHCRWGNPPLRASPSLG